jgi:hypothetical protein
MDTDETKAVSTKTKIFASGKVRKKSLRLLGLKDQVL